MGIRIENTPAMTGNGVYIYTNYKHGDDWGKVYHCYTHIIFYETTTGDIKSYDDVWLTLLTGDESMVYIMK